MHNSIERYGITSGMPLDYHTDGSLDVFIQARSPGADKEANWLPYPPSGPFNVTAGVYQPKRTIMDGRAEANVVVEAGSYEIPPINKVN